MARRREPATQAPPVLLDHVLERMTDAFIALDREWRIVYMNSAAMGTNVKVRPDAIGKSHWEVWPQTVGSELERQYRASMETQRAVHFEHHYTVPGADYWHEIHAYPDANGLSVFYRDITADKRAEELASLLAAAGSRFAHQPDLGSTLRSVAEMALPLLGDWSVVYLVDEGWRVTDVDTAAVDVLRLEVLRNVLAQLPPVATDMRLPSIRAMHTGDPVLTTAITDEFYVPMREREEGALFEDFMRALTPVSLLSVPLIARGRTIGGITFGRSEGHAPHSDADLTAALEVGATAALALDNARLFDAQRKARQEAEDARRRAEEANRSKAEFLRAMSHELRTPLNAIGGYAQLLSMSVHGDLSPKQREDVERIARNLKHVNRLIDDVVNFTRLEAGKVDFERGKVQVRALLTDIEELLGPSAMAGGRTLKVLTDADAMVWADAAKAKQVLVNLVANALKHTPPETKVEVSCECTAADGRVRIRVRDTGQGIARDKQQSIFEPFVQLNRSLKHPVPGLGLGLAIARDLASGMGAELTVESEPGQGATFTLSLQRAD